MGEKEIKTLFAYWVQWPPKEIKKSSSRVLSHTTVQGNNVMVPTDAQRNQKVIDQYNQIAKKENIKQCQRVAKASASNFSWEASSTSQNSRLQTQDLHRSTSPRARTKTSSLTKRSVPKRTGSVPTSDPSTAIRSKQNRCHSRAIHG